MRNNLNRIASILEKDIDFQQRLEEVLNEHRQSEEDVRRRMEIELAIKEAKIPVLPQTPERIYEQLNQLSEMYHASCWQRIKNRIKTIIWKYTK